MQADNLQEEKEFFQKISSLVFNLLSSLQQKTLTVRYKQKAGTALNPVISSDLAVENLLIKEINRKFPGDAILGEEGSFNSGIDPNARTWILDPICGTINYSRGIKNFCTNIALIYQNTIIAACVLDHGREEFIWSTGNNLVYINNEPVEKYSNHKPPLIDINLGGTYYVNNNEVKRKYANFLYKILTETNYLPVSYNTSQGFSYVAIGKLDGYFIISAHIWDIAAANFLIIQSGGTISDIYGKPWTLNSTSVIATRNKIIHAKLLDLYLNS